MAVKITDYLNVNDIWYAHCPEEEGGTGKGKYYEKETLQEHTKLVCSYADKLVEEKNINAIVNTLFLNIFEDGDKTVLEFLWSAFSGAIELHDIGKVNPLFQKNKMDNIVYKDIKYSNLKGSNHALLSSIYYMDIYRDLVKTRNWSDETKRKVRWIILVNAFIISKHHSSLSSLYKYIEKYGEGGEINEFVTEYEKNPLTKELKMKFLTPQKCVNVRENYEKWTQNITTQQSIGIYIYSKLLYSVLVASDYYATTEYMSKVKVTDFGNIKEGESLAHEYNNSILLKKIRKYEESNRLMDLSEMNKLRSELFLEVEKNWRENKDENLFFLEAPTGSGKSNLAMNISIHMNTEGQKKIFYIYPFNTLVDQNITTFRDSIFSQKTMENNFAVINSVTPMKHHKESESSELDIDISGTLKKQYIETLLDKQFLNYPVVVSTHVSLFSILFGNYRENIFAFLQLCGCVIVLDEIQSYKNTIWAEIISFLQVFSRTLNMKVIIMSATLPELSYLDVGDYKVVKLNKESKKYFGNPIFKDRVNISYELLEDRLELEDIVRHIRLTLGIDEKATETSKCKKVLIEFIKKETANKFFELLKINLEDTNIYIITGDDTAYYRKKILERVKKSNENVVLIGTQVVEAGLDIDMDIGYKDISFLDSEEQFMGRINRSCKNKGIVYFFDYDDVGQIYRNDVRGSVNYRLPNQEMKGILKTKLFEKYYGKLLQILKTNRNEATNEDGLMDFFDNKVRFLDFEAIEKRMQLIEPNLWKVELFLNVEVENEHYELMYGNQVWEEYKEMLENDTIDYAEKRVRLSEIKSKMTNFVYQVPANDEILALPHIGNLYYMDDGKRYFEEGRFNTLLLKKETLFY